MLAISDVIAKFGDYFLAFIYYYPFAKFFSSAIMIISEKVQIDLESFTSEGWTRSKGHFKRD